MKRKTSWIEAAISVLTIWSVLFGSIPVKAQDIVTSQDISGGSSVFVFRRSVKASQFKAASKTTAKRTASQKADSRRSSRDQIAKATPTRKRVAKVDPTKLVAMVKPPKGKPKGTKPTNGSTGKVMTPKEISDLIAGGGEAALDDGDYDRAITYFTDAIKEYPQNTAAKQGLSEALTKKGDKIQDRDGSERAIPYYKEAIKNDETNAAAFAALGTIYDELDDIDAALANYQAAVTINSGLTELYAPLGVAYYQKGEIAKADDFLTKAAAANGENDQTQFLLGIIRYKQNRNDEAITALKRSINIKDSAEGHYYLGEVYDRLSKDNDAIAEYRKAVTIDPNYNDAWFDLGVSLYNRERYEESIAAYETSKKLKNSNPQVWLNLADVYRQLKKFNDAIGNYSVGTTFMESDKAFTASDKAEVYSKYGYCYGQLKNWDGAVIQLNKAIALQPDDIDYTNLGWAYFNAAKNALAVEKDQAKTVKSLQNAKAALIKATELNKSSTGAYFNLGVTLTGLGEFQGSVDALKRANELKRDWDTGLYELGFAYKQLKDFKNAAAAFKRFTELNKLVPEAFFEWGFAENAAGNKNAAKEALKKLQGFKNNRRAAELAAGLDLAIKGAVLDQGKQRLESKVNEKIPIRIPKLPY